jgi:hypothetical protein
MCDYIDLIGPYRYQVPTEGEKKSSQSSVVTIIHMEGLDKLNKVSQAI